MPPSRKWMPKDGALPPQTGDRVGNKSDTSPYQEKQLRRWKAIEEQVTGDKRVEEAMASQELAGPEEMAQASAGSKSVQPTMVREKGKYDPGYYIEAAWSSTTTRELGEKLESGSYGMLSPSGYIYQKAMQEPPSAGSTAKAFLAGAVTGLELLVNPASIAVDTASTVAGLASERGRRELRETLSDPRGAAFLAGAALAPGLELFAGAKMARTTKTYTVDYVRYRTGAGEALAYRVETPAETRVGIIASTEEAGGSITVAKPRGGGQPTIEKVGEPERALTGLAEASGGVEVEKASIGGLEYRGSRPPTSPVYRPKGTAVEKAVDVSGGEGGAILFSRWQPLERIGEAPSVLSERGRAVSTVVIGEESGARMAGAEAPGARALLFEARRPGASYRLGLLEELREPSILDRLTEPWRRHEPHAYTRGFLEKKRKQMEKVKTEEAGRAGGVEEPSIGGGANILERLDRVDEKPVTVKERGAGEGQALLERLDVEGGELVRELVGEGRAMFFGRPRTGRSMADTVLPIALGLGPRVPGGQTGAVNVVTPKPSAPSVTAPAPPGLGVTGRTSGRGRPFINIIMDNRIAGAGKGTQGERFGGLELVRWPPPGPRGGGRNIPKPAKPGVSLEPVTGTVAVPRPPDAGPRIRTMTTPRPPGVSLEPVTGTVTRPWSTYWERGITVAPTALLEPLGGGRPPGPGRGLLVPGVPSRRSRVPIGLKMLGLSPPRAPRGPGLFRYRERVRRGVDFLKLLGIGGGKGKKGSKGKDKKK